MKNEKGIKNDITKNDGRPVVVVKTLADIEKLKECKEKKIDARIVMHPNDSIDPYPALVKAMTDLLGTPEKIVIGSFKKEIRN